ncbi:hypothetical protein [Variovorax sp. N23]|uniref:hypothetical protein n=1 Tax=Variovorax sp. N23 TaxID=2980555 RepID=UPI0021C83FB5|nr:hypothetical protein [Variovorax sp. N23]MCU4118870.1 hypothetical protein [Variovorax sp. N23]
MKAPSIIPTAAARDAATVHAHGAEIADLTISINPEWTFVEYVGTWAQLVGEGLISDGAEKPIGRRREEWKSGSFTYWLRRTRPVDFKGKQKESLRSSPTSSPASKVGRPL